MVAGTQGGFPRANTSIPPEPHAFTSVASISSQQPHFMRQCGMPACCTLAGGRSPSRAVGCNSPQKRAAPEPCGPGALLGTDLGQRSIVMSAEPPVLYENGPVAMTKYGHVSHMGKCWHYPTAMISQLATMWTFIVTRFGHTKDVSENSLASKTSQSDAPVGKQPYQTQEPKKALHRIIRDSDRKARSFQTMDCYSTQAVGNQSRGD